MEGLLKGLLELFFFVIGFLGVSITVCFFAGAIYNLGNGHYISTVFLAIGGAFILNMAEEALHVF